MIKIQEDKCPHGYVRTTVAKSAPKTSKYSPAVVSVRVRCDCPWCENVNHRAVKT